MAGGKKEQIVYSARVSYSTSNPPNQMGKTIAYTAGFRITNYPECVPVKPLAKTGEV